MLDYDDNGDLIVNVRTPVELFEALDALHTQVLDNISEATSAPYTEILERAMREVDEMNAKASVTP